MSKTCAAKTYGVPRKTLCRLVGETNKRSTGANKVSGNFQTTFSAEIEANLVEYLLQMEKAMFGLTTADICCLAYQMAEKNNIAHKFNKETKSADKDWLYNLKRIHSELSLRSLRQHLQPERVVLTVSRQILYQFRSID